jgi:hypothetical protein
MQDVYAVEGGWHAFDPDVQITTFGATKEEALDRLGEAKARRLRLLALSQAMKAHQVQP